MRHGLLPVTVHLFVIFYFLSFAGCEIEDVRALKHVAVGFLHCKIGTGLLKRREVYLSAKGVVVHILHISYCKNHAFTSASVNTRAPFLLISAWFCSVSSARASRYLERD